MKKIKKPSVANAFYSGNPAELSAQILSFQNDNYNNSDYKARAVIVPHAGLIYSGRLAYEGINQLDKDIKNIFILGPAHKKWFDGIGVTSYDEWETPLGNIEINTEITKELIEKYGAAYQDEALAPEHSIEIQVPIIQSVIGNVKIIPILIANQSTDLITKIIQDYWADKQNGFVISSDLSHFLDDEEAKKLDLVTAQMIEKADFNGVTREQACGIMGIIGLCNFAKQNNFSMIRVDMINSAFVTKDVSSVVGYGTWFLYEGEKNNYIKEYYGNFILDLAKTVIESSFDRKPSQHRYPQVLDEYGACFVTLEKNGRLRGCIGSMSAYQPLIIDIVHHASDAAFKDPRFSPVTKDEVKDLSLSVSLLSTPVPIEFKDEEDLLNKIVPFEDGLIIQDGKFRSIYLPVVWEQIPEKKDFLASLKIKAGMKPDYFSQTFTAYKFRTIYIK